MEKIKQSIICLSVIAVMASCGSADKKANESAVEENPREENVEVKEIKINTAESKVMWEGTVLGVYSHSGIVNVSEGMFVVEGNQITKGKFIADLTSMEATDDNYNPEEGKTKEKLIGHLSSSDFFQVDTFPNAVFEVKSHDVESGVIVGDLTIRGTTKEETIKDVSLNLEEGTASGNLTFDRRAYGVAFTHPAKDVVIADDVELNIKLKM